jgi:hypothetical protein
MKLETKETITRYVLTLTKDEYRDLRLLFAADTNQLITACVSGATNANTITHDRLGLIEKMRQLPLPEKK